MSEASKEGRKQNRAKAMRLAGPGVGRNDPGKPVDASGWKPPEALDAGRKTGARPIRSRIYKHGGKIQGDRAPRNPGKACRGGAMATGGRAACADGGNVYSVYNTAKDNEKKLGSFHEGGYKRGGMPKAGASLGDIKKDVHKHESHMHKGEPKTKLATGGKASGTYFGGTRPTGGRMPRASGGRAKGKTNINIVIAQPKQQQQPMMPPQGPVRPPMPPPQMQPPAGGPPPMPMGGPPPGPPGGMPGGAGPMMRKAGGRANAEAIPIRHAGAGSGEGRLERMAIQKRSKRADGGAVPFPARKLYAQTYAKHAKTIHQAKDAETKAYQAVAAKHGDQVMKQLRDYHETNVRGE